jgi:hypothetical protein
VEQVEAEGESPQSVTLTLDGVVVGATGREASLELASLRSVSGSALVAEGATVRLSQFVDEVTVMVFPNPVRLSRHEPELTVGQLPQDATVRIYSPAGRLVNVLSGEDTQGRKATWDLRTRRGEMVPSGIYLIRVQAPNASPVIKKAAVIR